MLIKKIVYNYSTEEAIDAAKECITANTLDKELASLLGKYILIHIDSTRAGELKVLFETFIQFHRFVVHFG